MSRKRFPTLRAYLRETRASQAELAERVGVTPSAMSLYVSGKRTPQPAIALELARICNIPIENLLSPDVQAKAS